MPGSIDDSTTGGGSLLGEQPRPGRLLGGLEPLLATNQVGIVESLEPVISQLRGEAKTLR